MSTVSRARVFLVGWFDFLRIIVISVCSCGREKVSGCTYVSGASGGCEEQSHIFSGGRRLHIAL